MKKKYPTILSMIIITILSACGPTPAPTLSPADVQGTAVANAWLAITQTQAAIPTATDTPVPTATSTPLLIPTTIVLTPLPTKVAVTETSAADDPCNQPPPVKPKGITVKVKLVNKSGGHVDLAFGMNQPNALKECGTYSFSLAQFDEPIVTVLAGCYWGYAWITGDKPSVAKTGSTILCLSDPDVVRSIWVTAEVIGFH